MTMKITTQDVTYVAALASLDVPESDKDELAEQLSRIVRYVEKLNELDTSEVPPTAQVTRGALDSRREDNVRAREGSGDAGRTVRLFNVPRVIGGR